MMEYQLTITVTGQQPVQRTVTGGTTTDLAQAVHQHVRGLLGGQVDIQLDSVALTGTLVQHRAVVGQFALEVAEQAPTPAPDTSAPDHVAHGYTLRDLHALARSACAADRSLSADMSTRYDTAWSAIAEHLCTAETPPGWNELTRVGWQAIYADVKAVRRLYGVDSTGRSGEVASAPRYVAYWTHVAGDGASEGIVERLAVHQVLATLPEHQREAVVALAIHDDYQRAADSLGLKYATLTARIRHGRRAVRKLWFSPETAPPTKGTDRRVASRTGVSAHCPQGHEYTPENTIRRPSSRGRRCRTCEQIRDAARNRGRAGVA